MATSSSSGPRSPEPEPTVDDLTNWFLAAKRSLSSMTLCQQANVLVDTAKAAIQEASVISARCVFLRNSLQDQLNIARQVSKMVQMRQDQLRGEFQVRICERGRKKKKKIDIHGSCLAYKSGA